MKKTRIRKFFKLLRKLNRRDKWTGAMISSTDIAEAEEAKHEDL